MKTPCQGLTGLLLGHKYVAQYDTKPPSPIRLGSGQAYGVAMVMESLTAKTYRCSVCVRCGDVKGEKV